MKKNRSKPKTGSVPSLTLSGRPNHRDGGPTLYTVILRGSPLMADTVDYSDALATFRLAAANHAVDRYSVWNGRTATDTEICRETAVGLGRLEPVCICPVDPGEPHRVRAGCHKTNGDPVTAPEAEAARRAGAERAPPRGWAGLAGPGTDFGIPKGQPAAAALPAAVEWPGPSAELLARDVGPAGEIRAGTGTIEGTVEPARPRTDPWVFETEAAAEAVRGSLAPDARLYRVKYEQRERDPLADKDDPGGYMDVKYDRWVWASGLDNAVGRVARANGYEATDVGARRRAVEPEPKPDPELEF